MNGLRFVTDDNDVHPRWLQGQEGFIRHLVAIEVFACNSIYRSSHYRDCVPGKRFSWEMRQWEII